MSNVISLKEALNKLQKKFPSFEMSTIKKFLYEENDHLELTIKLLQIEKEKLELCGLNCILFKVIRL